MSASARATSEIEVAVRHTGRRALFIVETGSRTRAQELLGVLGRMPCEVRPIVLGPVVACAVRAAEDSDALLERMTTYLRGRYSLAICEPGFTASMYRVALQLARDAEGEVRPLESCAVCGAAEPFPTTLSLRSGEQEATAHFCAGCLRDAPTDPAALCRLLLGKADDLAPWRDAALGEPLVDGGVVRFAIRIDEPVAAVV